MLLSPNEDSDFFHNQQNATKRKKLIGKRSFVFLINNLLDYLGRVVICVNIVCFPNHRQKGKYKKVKICKKILLTKLTSSQ